MYIYIYIHIYTYVYIYTYIYTTVTFVMRFYNVPMFWGKAYRLWRHWNRQNAKRDLWLFGG